MADFSHVKWPLSGYDVLDRFGYDAKTRFPIKFLRYWFCRGALAELHARLGRPLNVLEVGIADGRMLAFLGGRPNKEGNFSLPDWIARWDGLDVVKRPETLALYSYSDYIDADVEAPFACERRYDAIVLLHVLEHLFKPEETMTRLSALLGAGGALVGGSPTMPAILAVSWEPLLRRKNAHVDVKSHRHLSVITAKRMRQFARQHMMDVQLLAGAFFCRWSGLFLENKEAWLRANLIWGALFPSLGGEIYFCIRKRS